MTKDELGDLALSFDIMRLGIKEKTEDLEQSRLQYQRLFESVPCYITVQDAQFRLVAHNAMFERDFGHSIGRHCYDAYKGRQTKCPNCAVEKSFQDGQVHSAEEKVLGADGSQRYFLNLTTPITDRKGEITAVMEMATDITDIRRLEEELKRSEEKYRLFFNNDPNPIFVFDAGDLEILDANQRAAGEYFYEPGELIGTNFLDLAHPGDRDKLLAFIKGGEAFMPRLRLVKKDGQGFFASLRASYGEHMGHRAVIATTSDITQRLETEQQLVQAAKMATLGEMSAGVAHELNQPLSAIAAGSNFVSKVLRAGRVPDVDTLGQVVSELLAQVERTRRIITHLREFGRKHEISARPLDINEPINGVFTLLGQQLMVHDIQVSLELEPGLPRIMGDQNRLEQVFINLVMNARDAIEERRRAEPGLAGRITVRSFLDGGRVAVDVSDNGPGIPQAQRDRIFEPFFTTKEVGKGTGLGLSISYGIVRDFSGSIEVSGGPGGGATFRLSFPTAAQEEA